MNSRLLILSLAASCVAACGGGGGGGEETSSTPAPAAPPPVVVTPVQGAGGIQVPEGFDFDTATTMQVLVRSQGEVATRTYLTVCRNKDDSSQADYDRCVLKTPVIAGELERSIRLPNDVEALTATLWSLQPAAPVRTVRWTRSSNDAGTLVVE